MKAEASMQPFIEDFEKYKLSPVGDGKVCNTCSDVAKEVFDIRDRTPGVNFPPLHPWCRCTFTIEVEDWDKWMDDYEARHSNGQSKSVVNRLGHDIIEPEDKSDLYTTLDQLSEDLEERSLQVNNYLNTLNLPNSKWSGQTIVKKRDELKSAGRKVKNCDIWLREDATVKTVVHEHLHARSVSRINHLAPEYLGYEEGAVELLADELCEKVSVSYTGTYGRYVNYLRAIQNIIGKNKDIYDFAVDLFKIDPDKRKLWLKNEVDSWIGKNPLRLARRKKLYELIGRLEE